MNIQGITKIDQISRKEIYFQKNEQKSNDEWAQGPIWALREESPIF